MLAFGLKFVFKGTFSPNASISRLCFLHNSDKEAVGKDMLLRLTTAQRQLLIALCKEGEDAKPTSAAFIKKYSLSSASTVQRSLSALLDRDILTSEAGRYSVYDYFLKFWMKRETGE